MHKCVDYYIQFCQSIFFLLSISEKSLIDRTLQSVDRSNIQILIKSIPNIGKIHIQKVPLINQIRCIQHCPILSQRTSFSS